jgi:acetylornithine/N-succinyldiaminopimelate aminotransferase
MNPGTTTNPGITNAPMAPPALAAREAAALLPTYRRKPVHFVSGHGPWLVDDAGREYLDFLSGLAVTSLGHAHPAVTAAVTQQAGRLVHTCNLYYTEPQVALAERLQHTLGWPDGRAFLGNSGAEAVEGALKLARRHGKRQHPDKVGVVSLQGSFHGRTMAALLATGSPAKHEPFEPLGDWVTHVPHDDPAALQAAVDESTCAVLVEVVQGEGGVIEVPDAVLAAARAACDRVDALLIVDEVQTGLGRLGTWYGWQGTAGPVQPDVVCLAKALANGLPIGAFVARGRAAEALGPGDHGSTFGGNPVACAAANAVIDTITDEDLVSHAARMGVALSARLDELVATRPLGAGRRGRGLLQALELDRPVAGAVAEAALRHGLVVNDVAVDAVRLAPPLIIDDAALDELSARLGRALDDAVEAVPGARS